MFGRRKCCACKMKGFLRFLVLRIIKKSPGITGSLIMEELEKRRGNRPSPGTIYPVLKIMTSEGWIKEEDKKYSITSEGNKVLKESTNAFLNIFHDMKEEFLKL